MSNGAVIPRPDMNVKIRTIVWMATFLFIITYVIGFGCRAIGSSSGPEEEKNMFGFVGRTGEVLTKRGFIPYVIVAAFSLTIGIIWKKRQLVSEQLSYCENETLLDDLAYHERDSVSTYIDRLRAKAEFESDMLSTRVARLLESWLKSGSPERIADMAVEEAEFDYSVRDDGHRLLVTLLWSIPIIGFVGTVMGIGSAVGGFESVMEAADDLQGLKDGIQRVTMSLSIAFDTTFLALILALFGTFAHTLGRSREDKVVEQIDTFVEDNIITKLHRAEEEDKVIRWLTKEEEKEAIQEAIIQHIPRPEDYSATFGRVIQDAAREISSISETAATLFRAEAEGVRGTITTTAEQQRGMTTTFAQGLAEQFQGALRELNAMQQQIAAGAQNMTSVITETGNQQRAESSAFAQSLREQLQQTLGQTNQVQQQIVSASQGLPAMIREAADEQRNQTNTFVMRLREEIQTSLHETSTSFERAAAAVSENMRGAVREAAEQQRGETTTFTQNLRDQMQTSLREITGAFERTTAGAIEGIGNAMRGAADTQRTQTESFVQSLTSQLQGALQGIERMQGSLAGTSEALQRAVQEAATRQRAEMDTFIQKFGQLQSEQHGAAEEWLKALREGQTAMVQGFQSHLDTVAQVQKAQESEFQAGEKRIQSFFASMEKSLQVLEKEGGQRAEDARQAAQWLENAQRVLQQTGQGLMAQMQGVQQFVTMLNNLAENDKALAERLQRVQADPEFRKSIDRFVAMQEKIPELADTQRKKKRWFGRGGA